MKTKIYIINVLDEEGGASVYYTERKDWIDWMKDQKNNTYPEDLKKIFEKQNGLTVLQKDEFGYGTDKAFMLTCILEDAPESKKEFVKWIDKNNFEIAEEFDIIAE